MLRHLNGVTAILSTLWGAGQVYSVALNYSHLWPDGILGGLFLVAGAFLWMRALKQG